MKRVALGLTLAVLAAGSAHAYVRTKANGAPVKWKRLPVTYKINPTGDPRITDGSDIQAVKNGFKTWEDANCSDFTATFAGDTTVTAPNSDGQIEVMWPPTTQWQHGGCSGGGCTLGVTNQQFRGDSTGWWFYDADIEFTPYVQFATDGNRYRSDLQSVATHEIGHLLGLDHTSISSATMYYSTSPGDISQRTLDTDDLNGVCAIYPNGQTPIGCTSAAQCDAGQLCMNSMCVNDPSIGGYGTTCRPDGSCSSASGFCITYQGSDVCTQACGSGCPNGDSCASLSGGGSACIPGTGGPVTPTKKPFGGSCTTGANCVSGICSAGMCTQSCMLGMSGACPAGNHCEVRPGGETLCMPGDPPKVSLGGTCAGHEDCASNICASSTSNPDDMFCTELCEPATGCPAGFDCIAAGGDQHACIRGSTPGPQPGQLGAPCTNGDMCDSAICVSAGYCSQLCDPAQASSCGTGFDCVAAGGGQNACAKADGGGSSGGCDVGASRGGGPSELVAGLFLLCLALLVVRRKRA